MMRSFTLLILTSLLSLTVIGQVTINNAVNATDGVQNVLLGTGVTATNITFSGNNAQIGSFTCAGICNLGLANGLVMGSGNIDQVPGNGGGAGTLGPAAGFGASDPDLVAIAGAGINDAAVLQFDFVPTGDTIRFRFVFGSDEYPEWVSAGYNDAFGFFLSGPGITGPYTNNAKNIALLPNNITPVTIDNVNAGQNSQYFINNNVVNANQIECDGYTVVLTAQAIVQCGQTYHFKLAIGDAGDTSYDSFVFLEAGSFQSNTLDLSFLNPGISPGANGLFEGCPAGNIVFNRPGGVSGDLTYDLSYTGTATSGVDYLELPAFITLPAGVNSVQLPITAINDGFGEGQETIIIQVESTVECATGISLTLNISELAPLSVNIPNIVVPCNQNAVVPLTISGGFGNYQVDWGSYGTGNPVTIPNPQNMQVPFTVTDVCQVPAFNGTANIQMQQYQPVQVNAGPDLTLDCNDAAVIPANTIGGNGTYTFEWFIGSEMIGTDPIITIADPVNSEVTVVATDGCGATGTDNVQITLPQTPIDIQLPATTIGTCNGFVDISALVSGGVGNYSYYWITNEDTVSTSATLNIASVHNQIISLTVEDECDNSATANTTIQVNPTFLNVSIGNDLTLDCLDDVTLSPVVTGGTGNYQYSWLLNTDLVSTQEFYTIIPDGNQQIMLMVNDECNAMGQDEIMVNVPAVPINIDLNASQSVTCLQNFTVSPNSVTGGVGTLNYSWLLNNSPFSQNSSFTYNTSTPVTFVLNVTDQCGNFATDQIGINLLPSQMTLSASANDDNICPGDPVVLTATVNNAIGSVSYIWSNSAQTANTTVTPQSTTTYQVGATDACGANLTGSVTVNVLTQTGPLEVAEETTLCPNVSSGDLINGGYLPYSVVYDTENLSYSNQSGSFTSSRLGSYEFVVTDLCGNQESGAVTIESCETIIPNIITPNNDGKNDNFEIEGIEGFKNSALKIYNRWGNLIFDAADYRNNWNGSDHKEGVYYYIFERSDGKNFEGSIQLVR